MRAAPVAIVTGSSSGFGVEIAHALRAEGYATVATVRTPISAPDALRNADVDIRILDVTDSSSREVLVSEVLRDYGRVDLLVNNAGVLATASIEDAPEEMTRLVFETNFFGPLELTRLVLPQMRVQRSGRVVNVTAMGALMDTPLFGVYCASKHALDSLTATVDLEGRAHGIRASSVMPGQFQTSISAKQAGVLISPPYQRIADALMTDREAHLEDAQVDYSDVVRAVLAAATDSVPLVRYLAGRGLVQQLATMLPELQRVHEINADRAGVGKVMVDQ